MTNLSRYGDIPLVEEEAEAMYDLEQLCNTPLPDISNHSMAVFGVISRNYHITEIRLFRSFFNEDAKLKEIPSSISKFSQLVTLDLSHNLIRELPPSLKELQDLENLYMDFNLFEEFPRIIYELSNLRQINLDDNNLSSIPKSLEPLSFLQSLQLAGNKLTSFPRTLKKNQYLRRLILSRNDISNIGFDQLAELTDLYILDIRGNDVGKKKIKQIQSFLRLQGVKRPKYKLTGQIHSVEDPFSLRNIRKKIETEPMEIDSSFDEYDYLRLYRQMYNR